MTRASVDAFQSLLHQGISLLGDDRYPALAPRLPRFNPFFIRASVYWAASSAKRRDAFHRFNPFFIRASVYWDAIADCVFSACVCFNPFFIRASVY